MEKFMRFLGVDLGGGKGKNTALAVLERKLLRHHRLPRCFSP